MTKFKFVKEEDCQNCKGSGYILQNIYLPTLAGVKDKMVPCTCKNGIQKEEVDITEIILNLKERHIPEEIIQALYQSFVKII